MKSARCVARDWHTTHYTSKVLDVLHVIDTRLRHGHLSVRVGNCLRRSVETAKISSSSSSSRSSDGNSSLLNEGGSASQVPQASVELAGCGSVVWPDSLSEWLVDGAGLQ